MTEGAASSARSRTVDAHVHVWDLARGEYPWLTPELAPLDRTFGASAIAAEPSFAARAPQAGDGERTEGDDRTLRRPDSLVLVQAADNTLDTRVMAAAAAALPGRIAGLVVWVPLDRSDQVPAALAEAAALAAAAGTRVVGVRTLQHDRSDPDWIISPDAIAGLRAVAAAGLPYDYVTASPGLLAHVPRLVGAVPDLRLVIDHLGKPPLAGRAGESGWDRWSDLLHAAAGASDGVVAKVSGLYPPAPASPSPADGEPPPPDDRLGRVLDVALAAFGPDRLLAGSDWPMTEREGGRAAVVTAVEDALRSRLGAVELGAVLGGTAERVYGVGVGPAVPSDPSAAGSAPAPAAPGSAAPGPRAR